MDYHILNSKKEIIASFKNEYDRGICVDTLCENFQDEVFYTQDNDEKLERYN